MLYPFGLATVNAGNAGVTLLIQAEGPVFVILQIGPDMLDAPEETIQLTVVPVFPGLPTKLQPVVAGGKDQE